MLGAPLADGGHQPAADKAGSNGGPPRVHQLAARGATGIAGIGASGRCGPAWQGLGCRLHVEGCMPPVCVEGCGLNDPYRGSKLSDPQ